MLTCREPCSDSDEEKDDRVKRMDDDEEDGFVRRQTVGADKCHLRCMFTYAGLFVTALQKKAAAPKAAKPAAEKTATRVNKTLYGA